LVSWNEEICKFHKPLTTGYTTPATFLFETQEPPTAGIKIIYIWSLESPQTNTVTAHRGGYRQISHRV